MSMTHCTVSECGGETNGSVYFIKFKYISNKVTRLEIAENL